MSGTVVGGIVGSGVGWLGVSVGVVVMSGKVGVVSVGPKVVVASVVGSTNTGHSTGFGDA